MTFNPDGSYNKPSHAYSEKVCGWCIFAAVIIIVYLMIAQ